MKEKSSELKVENDPERKELIFEKAINFDPKLSNTKPDYGLDRTKERNLVRLATTYETIYNFCNIKQIKRSKKKVYFSGIVTLFNAVSERQRFMDANLKKLTQSKRPDRKRIINDIKATPFDAAVLPKKKNLKRVMADSNSNLPKLKRLE